MGDERIDPAKLGASDQGGLAKDQILETQRTPAEGPQAPQRRVVVSASHIENRPPTPGCLEASRCKGSHLEEPSGDSPSPPRSWEEETDDWLARHLTYRCLAKLLGPFVATMERDRRATTGTDKRSTRKELAAALRRRHGRNLLRDPAVRKAVAKAAGVPAPGWWRPGKRSAVKFVADAGLPAELVSISDKKPAPNVEVLRGRSSLPPLLDFQKELKDELDWTLENPGERGMFSSETGTGKTRVGIESIRDCFANRSRTADSGGITNVLWLAHTEELCEQPCECFTQVWDSSEGVEPLELVRYWGSYAQDLARTSRTLESPRGRLRVLVSTPQRIVQLLDNPSEVAMVVARLLARNLRAIFVDEAHRGAALSYQRILQALSPPDGRVSVIGLTATPFREVYHGCDSGTGTEELRRSFRRLKEPIETLGENPRARLQEMGVLARPIFKTISTNLSIWLRDVPAGPYHRGRPESSGWTPGDPGEQRPPPPGDPQGDPADRRSPRKLGSLFRTQRSRRQTDGIPPGRP